MPRDPRSPPGVPFGPFAPDISTYTPGIMIEAKNTLAGIGGYRPQRQLVQVTSALEGPAQGAIGYNNDEVDSQFAGTASKLYRIAGSTPSDVSLAAGYTTATNSWNFAVFGNRVMATNYTDAVQSYVVGTSTLFADLAAAAPKARVIATVKNFVMLGNTVDGVDGAVAERVWWSAFEDPTDWPTPASDDAITKQSDYQDLYNSGGSVQAIVPNLVNADAVVIQTDLVVRVNYVGAQAGVFAFDPIDGSRGTPYPNSAVEKNGICYFVSDDGLYQTDGVSVRPFGVGKVDRWLAGKLQGVEARSVRAAADPIDTQIYWCWPGNYLAYNWITKEFAHGEWAALVPFAGYSLSALVDEASGTVDLTPIPVDDPRWSGGRRIMSFIDSDGMLSYASGLNAEAVLTTGDANPAGHRAMRITETWPIVDASEVFARLDSREYLGGALRQGIEYVRSAVGYCPTNERGRYFRARVRIPAGASWRFAQGLEINGEDEGRRA